MKWIRLIGLVTVCWACLWAASMAAPNAKESQWQQWQEQLEAQKKAADELKADNKELLDRLKVQETALLETQRKSIDWWLSAIGVVLTVVSLVIAVVGVFLPWYWQRLERRRLEQAQAEFARMNAEAMGLLNRLQSYEAAGAKAAVEASMHAEASKNHAHEIDTWRKTMKGFLSEQKRTSDVLPETRAREQAAKNTEAANAARQLSRQAEATETDKLRARAIEAASMESPNDEQALKIYELWHVLTVLNPADSNAQFNSGYWAQELYERGVEPGRKYWLNVLGKHYQNALHIDKGDDAAAYNWGIALAGEALAVKDQDMAAARALWKAAGEQYVRALTIKPNKHEAANNWGNALAAEAQAVKEQDLPLARALWKAASEQFARALAMKPDEHEVAFNWGHTLDDEAHALKEQDLGAARALWKAAGAQFARALEIKPEMHEAALSWGNAFDDEAQALKETDLQAARALWKAAGEQYAKALELKPDMHEAANNWCSAWLRQFHAFSEAKDSVGASETLESTIKLLESHSANSPEGIPDIAYNLACAYALAGRNADALKQLVISSRNGLLPSHWREDKDLAGLRSTAEYTDWVASQPASDTQN